MGPKREIRNHIICENKKFRHKCFVHISIICFKSKNIKMGKIVFHVASCFVLVLSPSHSRWRWLWGPRCSQEKDVGIRGHFLTSLVQKGTCHTAKYDFLVLS